MQKIKILENFHPMLNKEKVFAMMNCFPDSPVYEEIEDTYYEIQDEILSLCKPKGVVAIGTIPAGLGTEEEREAIYLLATIGAEISERSTKAFSEGDYVQGMMIDAMADILLFSLENDMQRALKEFCGIHKKGIVKRIEPPKDIPMEIQKVMFEQTKAKELLGMDLSSGYMFWPVKSSPQVYITTDDEEVFRAHHNCRNCPNKTCFVRHIEPIDVKVITAEGEEMMFVMKEEGTLMDGFRQADIKVHAPCGGNGSCGKCKVQVIEGDLAITTQDENLFTKEELAEGWRLACKAIPMDHLTVRLGWKSEQKMDVQAGFAGVVKKTEDDSVDKYSADDGYGIAIDIGTTTLAVQLVDLGSGQVVGTQTGLNNQRTYGADVITRILAATQGKELELTVSIRKDLNRLMVQLCEEHAIKFESIAKIVIAGNTTMTHLLMGYPCDGLGKVPFTPYEIGTIRVTASELFEDCVADIEVLVYPSVTTFVGADIVSGMCALHMASDDKVSLLVDLGTNGEMALGNKDKLLVTSTAAGPAFEGGNITWGTGSIPGAICNAEFENGKLSLKTIQDKEPTGICGTGVIELVAALVKEELIDETGLLDDDWFDDGYPVAVGSQGEEIVLTQKDIREIQLAKAAVRGGIETLLHHYGVSAEEVDTVYVAGGFGYALDYQKAMEIGMFPEKFEGKIKAVGNSSLGGAVKLLVNSAVVAEAERLANFAEEIDLSTDKVFQNAYIEAMYFEEL